MGTGTQTSGHAAGSLRAWQVRLAALLPLLAAGAVDAQQPARMRVPAPELRDVAAWINTEPLKLADLRGKVVVLHFWTFG